jgi:hypothetical protein
MFKILDSYFLLICLPPSRKLNNLSGQVHEDQAGYSIRFFLPFQA